MKTRRSMNNTKRSRIAKRKREGNEMELNVNLDRKVPKRWQTRCGRYSNHKPLQLGTHLTSPGL